MAQLWLKNGFAHSCFAGRLGESWRAVDIFLASCVRIQMNGGGKMRRSPISRTGYLSEIRELT